MLRRPACGTQPWPVRVVPMPFADGRCPYHALMRWMEISCLAPRLSCVEPVIPLRKCGDSARNFNESNRVAVLLNVGVEKPECQCVTPDVCTMARWHGVTAFRLHGRSPSGWLMSNSCPIRVFARKLLISQSHTGAGVGCFAAGFGI